MAASVVQSPKSPFFLGSNDDQMERAAARAARAAAVRRNPVEIASPQQQPPPRPSLSSNSFLTRDQIIELFRNCYKLASENRINQKNTWELKLIDHISEIIKVDAEDHNYETNFQKARKWCIIKASCTLEAGVKIYAARVDAWHADAYRVLSTISGAGFQDDQGISVEGDKTTNERDVIRPKKETYRKASPLLTVESSSEALNVKKFDVAFVVDPLYSQSSAQFDEGGAKGLLLYNLGVYGRCWVLFDSNEVPAKCIRSTNVCNSSDLVDIFFAKDCIDQLVANMRTEQHISPTLGDITNSLEEQYFMPRIFDGPGSFEDGNSFDKNTQFNVGKENFGDSDVIEDMGPQIANSSYDDSEAWFANDHENVTVSDEGSNMGDPMMQSHYEEEEAAFASYESEMNDRFESVTSFFCGGLGVTSLRNRWAGPDHWKYRKPTGLDSVFASDSGLDSAAKRPRNKKSKELDIEFTSYLDEGLPDIFAPAKNPKSLLLPPRKIPSSNTLPEDCHYQPEDLVRLFLRPDIMCLGKRSQRRVPDSDFGHWQNHCDGSHLLNKETSASGLFEDECIHSDLEGCHNLVRLIKLKFNMIKLQNKLMCIC